MVVRERERSLGALLNYDARAIVDSPVPSVAVNLELIRVVVLRRVPGVVKFSVWSQPAEVKDAGRDNAKVCCMTEALDRINCHSTVWCQDPSTWQGRVLGCAALLIDVCRVVVINCRKPPCEPGGDVVYGIVPVLIDVVVQRCRWACPEAANDVVSIPADQRSVAIWRDRDSPWLIQPGCTQSAVDVTGGCCRARYRAHLGRREVDSPDEVIRGVCNDQAHPIRRDRDSRRGVEGRIGPNAVGASACPASCHRPDGGRRDIDCPDAVIRRISHERSLAVDRNVDTKGSLKPREFPDHIVSIPSRAGPSEG
mmetsp:Transcript_56780/g.137270  ORF Transcript_56780/g.137270 Transcript_56780/m.137270 type:complete len:310 (-) Transcript_56780:1040-1969(-)